MGGVVQPGIQLDLLQRLTCAVAKVEHTHERMAVMIIDEMTIKGGLCLLVTES